jgi:hypothetical protein
MRIPENAWKAMSKDRKPMDCPDIDATLAAAHTIRRAEKLGKRGTFSDGNTEAYAEPTPTGTVWGVNRPGFGFNVLKPSRS